MWEGCTLNALLVPQMLAPVGPKIYFSDSALFLVFISYNFSLHYLQSILGKISQTVTLNN